MLRETLGRPRVAALVATLALLIATGGNATPVNAAGIVVDSLADLVADDGTCTLREAIIAANTDTPSGASSGECPAGSGADTITFSVAGTITLGAGLPSIAGVLTIDGTGSVTVDGANAHRPITIGRRPWPVGSDAVVTLAALAVVRGHSDTAGGGIWVLPGATLEVVQSTITDCTAGWAGGGIYREGYAFSTGSLTVRDSVISGNMADNGGGLYIGGDGAATITGSIITGNKAPDGSGGGFSYSGNGGSLVVTGSAIRQNTAEWGGGILLRWPGRVAITESFVVGNDAVRGGGLLLEMDGRSGPLVVTRSSIDGNIATSGGGGISAWCEAPSPCVSRLISSTVSHNRAGGSGGGIEVASRSAFDISYSTIEGNRATDGGGVALDWWHWPDTSAAITNSTIIGNAARSGGGGVYNDGGSLIATNSTITGNEAHSGGGIANDGTLHASNTIVAGNVGGEVLGSQATSKSSLIGVPDGLTIDDILDPASLADNGGPTRTIALVPTAANPAIDAGDPEICAAPPVGGLDQRGMTRPAGPCDLGAYEHQGGLVEPSPGPAPSAEPSASPSPGPSTAPAPSPSGGGGVGELTPPPTETLAEGPPGGAPPLPPALLVLLATGLLALTASRRRAARRRSGRRA